jgi:hypothetical protein
VGWTCRGLLDLGDGLRVLVGAGLRQGDSRGDVIVRREAILLTAIGALDTVRRFREYPERAVRKRHCRLDEA